MPFTPNDLVLDMVSSLKKGNGGAFTFGYRPESGPEGARVPARWEASAVVGGSPGKDSRTYARVDSTFEGAVEKLLSAVKGEV